MCDCTIFSKFLINYEQRISQQKKGDQNFFKELRKSEIDIVLGYIQLWPQRQCMCCYRDLKNFDRFNFVIHSLIYLVVSKLKNINQLIQNTNNLDEKLLKASAELIAASNNNDNKPKESANEENKANSDEKPTTVDDKSENVESKEENSKNEESKEKEEMLDDSEKKSEKPSAGELSESSEAQQPSQSCENPTKQSKEEFQEEIWILPELEKLLIFVSKIFLLNFPLYIAYKHGVHGSRVDDITPQEAQTLSMFCDIHDSEIPVYLYRNVTVFCSSGGFGAMAHCFEINDLPVSTAHACTVAISNIKLWLNYRSIVQLFVPLRNKVLNYMCNLPDQDLRSSTTKSMADFMWTAIKDPLESQITFDTEGLALAFKYFTSSTLTMRLAGMSQINAHINLFNDICTTETVAEVEVVGRKLADWLTENQIITHLFGPNLHVEVIKQSHIVLNFLAVENQITEEHISMMWQAAQLKHCSKQVYDILPSLVKNLAPKPAAHLYSMLCRLDPKEHTEQSIYIVSALTKLIWARDRSRQLTGGDIVGANISRDIREIPSSSENSVSADGTNSDEEHPDEDSSDCRKSPASDTAPPPCKQARHITAAAIPGKKCFNEIADDVKVEPDIYEIEKEKRIVYPILGHHIAAFNEGSSSDECLEVNENIGRKKYRMKRKKMLIRKRLQEMVESISDNDSHSDPLFGGSDCSEPHMREEVLEHINKDDSFFRAIADNQIMDFLQAAENDGSSSIMSNKSEKNMADFDDEDSPCEEELAQLAASSPHCLPQFSLPRSRADINRSSTPPTAKKLNKEHNKSTSSSGSGDKMLKASGSGMITSSPQKSSDICQPGSTLLWDLLQDDKIGFLGEPLATETEKALSTLICYHTDKMVRKRFIEACLTNLANNRSVIVSLRLIPKLLASFQQFRDIGTHQVTMWAEKHHKMMYQFFNNLKCYSSFVKSQRQQNQTTYEQNMQQMEKANGIYIVLNQNGEPLYSHITQIQARLNFLSSIFCEIGSPKNFRLSLSQVDTLWACLSNDIECADCLFHWLQGQVKGGSQHALGSNALQHIYLKRLSELKPENISMVALALFQQLFVMGITEQLKDENSDVAGMDYLWKIALRANDTEVSLAAIQYINTYYMEHQLKNEHEFVSQCMSYLKQAAEGLNTPEVEERSIMCVQRALMLLNTHLETFRRRYAYHLRRWALDGKGINSHSNFRSEGPGPPIKIILQPGGLPDKSILTLSQSDLIADLKAEIAKWWENLQGSVKTGGGSTAPVLGHLLSEGPLRIITQGQEITADYDERSLMDVGFKDNQIVYVSLGGRGGRRREHLEHPSMLPPPAKECLPTVLLLKSPYFEQLFHLMQTLGNMKMKRKSGFSQHTQAQVLSRRVWDILAMLPTSPQLLETFKSLKFDDGKDDSKKTGYSLKEVLDPSNFQKFMYSLHIVESLCKSKFGAKMTPVKQQLKMKITKQNKEKLLNAKKSGCSKENDPGNEAVKSNDSNSKAEEGSSNNKEEDAKMSENSSSKEIDPEQLKADEMKKALEWSEQFIKVGGLKHLFDILMSGALQRNNDDFDEWRHDCLCSLLMILCLLGVEDFKQEENVIVIPKLSGNLLSLMDVKRTIERFSSILNEAAMPIRGNHYKTGFWGRAQVINYVMNLLVCFAYSSSNAREQLWTDPSHYSWLQKLILDDPDPHVRREACAALYRLCMGNSKTYSDLIVPLLVKLITFLPVAEKMKPQSQNFLLSEEGKEPYGKACRDYFWLLARLIDTTPEILRRNYEEQQNSSIDIESLCLQVSKGIIDRDFLEGRHGANAQDDGLVGLLNLMANLMKYDPPFKFSNAGQQFIAKIFECLFALPVPENRDLPKCKSQGARAASYDLLIEMCRNSPKNYLLLHRMLIIQHRPGPNSPYPWDYWPRDDGRSECGYVGLTNLGATCYMASCIQHIFMMPQAREAILSVSADAPVKHKNTLHELQKMFAFLLESVRKAYNPRSFCRVYQMDHQPLNTGEQKDMAEFFIDLVSKLEEMTPDLKSLVKRIFCGVLSNNVVSLDCGHVSRTLEEFYTVRCQVADMRNLQESLDEVTVKDTLEGDNMYTCSQCGRKVRAEKRACFKKLPQILCFNTMRYTFNMVTMLKEKVNTHFSFPMRLDMSGYVEKTLMPQHYQEEKRKSELRRKISECDNQKEDERMDIDSEIDQQQSSSEHKKDTMDEEEQIKQEQQNMDEEESEDFNENYEYDLVGVTVHTGTADGGHYYSFIKERDNGNGGPSDRWFFFNDAEVKLFDPSQIAAECFGGEMTSKTYDSVSEKYLDFSFEKTNSAYMLFYEWRSNKGGNVQRDQCQTPTSSTSSQSSLNDNMINFKRTFNNSYYQNDQKPGCSKESLSSSLMNRIEIDLKNHLIPSESETTTENENSRRKSNKEDEKMEVEKETAASSSSSDENSKKSENSASDNDENNKITDKNTLVNTKLETENSNSSNLNKISDKIIDNNECDIDNKLKNSSSNTASTSVTSNKEKSEKPICNFNTDQDCKDNIEKINNILTEMAENHQLMQQQQSMCKSKNALVKAPPIRRKSILSKELEEWIWQDNRHYLEDRNIFEHTYFNFIWQVCGHLPQTLMIATDITSIAAQLSVSFFIETFIHAKEKPTMVLWVELLTKQFNASQDACEWFLTHMSKEPWWPVQVLIQCPNQMVRQMFQRLVIHVIQRLRQTHSPLYLATDKDEDGNEIIGEKSSVTKFIKSLILLMEHGAKAHLRHLSEFFGLLLDFSRMGEEETAFLLKINVIKSVADFYLGHKNQDCIDTTTSDNDDNSSDETLSVDKNRPASLDKMIALVASLVERSRGPDLRLRLSTRDYNAVAGGKGFPFLYQQIKDNINPHQTRHLIHALCRYDERLASQIITMLFTAVTKHTELCGPFFKLLTLLTESSSGPSGLPCFSQLVLQRVWEAAEYCPQSALEWLAVQAPRNKIAHNWVLSTAESWVEQFLLAHSNIRVRNAAANLLVSLVPSQSFRSNYRSTHHKISLNSQPRELNGEAQIILHTILNILLRLLRPARNYADISTHGTVKLTSYFTLMTYCMITKTEKLMLGQHIRALWDLFHPKLSEPSVPAHHNKQALLSFWYHATNDCPENAEIVANNPEITKNIAFNYILADHEDSEVIAYNRSMLPVYYGLLRLCCQQSRTLTRQLAGHQNLQWAFKNITPHPTQYPLAVDELFKLMSLFVTRYPDSTASELEQICLFRRQTLSAYLTGLDARVSWNTLVSALRILVDNDEDRLFFVSNGGLLMCFEALLTLHSMYHEATACHVSEDLQDLLKEIVRLLQALRQSCREQRKRTPPAYFKGLPEVLRRLVTLLNTFNPPEMRRLTLEVLRELVRCVPQDAINILTTLLTHCHTQNPQHSMGPLGTFFPRRSTNKTAQISALPATWPPGPKNNIPRPPRPMIQMNIPRTQVFVKGIDKEFDLAVERFYKPYHDFLDTLFRMAVTCGIFNETLTNLSLLVGIEAVGWHFNLFPAFWVGIYQNKTTNRFAELLINNPLLHEYIDTILKDERMSLNDSIIANFVEIYYSKIQTRLSIPRLLDSICTNLVKKDNLEDVCGDLHAIRIIGQTGGFPTSVKNLIQNSLQSVLIKYKDEFANEETPPKKRKLDVSSDEKEVEEKMDQTESAATEDDVTMVSENSTPKEEDSSKKEEQIDGSSKAPEPSNSEDKSEQESGKVNSSKPESSSSSSSITHRMELLKDIESHIEIIFECLDDEIIEEINQSESSSMNTQNTSESSCVITSSEISDTKLDSTVDTEMNSEATPEKSGPSKDKKSEAVEVESGAKTIKEDDKPHKKTIEVNETKNDHEMKPDESNSKEKENMNNVTAIIEDSAKQINETKASDVL